MSLSRSGIEYVLVPPLDNPLPIGYTNMVRGRYESRDSPIILQALWPSLVSPPA